MSGERDDIPVPEADLLAYADGRLPPERRAEVAATLAAHPALAAEVADWQRQTETIVALYPVPGPADRPGLDPRRVADRLRRASRAGALRAAAAVLLLALGTAVGWAGRGLLDPGPLPSDRLVARATVAHSLYSRENRHAVEVAAADQPHLQTWLSNRLGTSLAAPDLSAHGFSLVGGRLLPPDPEAGAGPAAQFMYENSSAQRLTVYVTPALPGGDKAYSATTEGGLGAIYWAGPAITCTVVADLPSEELHLLAGQVYRQLTRATDTAPVQGS